MVAEVLDGEALAFAAITMLRKCCNHPDLLRLTDGEIPSDELFWERSGKFGVLKELLELWKKDGHRALIFSQTRSVLSMLEKMVGGFGYDYFRMDGNTSIKSRLGWIDQYNDPKGPFLFLLTTKVGGLGINLIGADRVLLFEPDWNPASDAQAKERAWRIGQTKEVTVYRFITAGTIEEKIYHRQLFKQFLSNKVLKDPTQRRFFKSNDLRDLFTLADDDGESTETQSLFNTQALTGIQATPAEETTEGGEGGEGGEGEKGGGGLLAQLVDNRGTHSVVDHDSIVGADLPPDKDISQP